MLSVSILRPLRSLWPLRSPCGLHQALAVTMRSASLRALSVRCVWSERWLHADRRLILQRELRKQVPALCPSIRCLSTSTSSSDGQLIYTGSLGKAIRGVKLFSYSTTGASLLLIPQILLKTGLGVQSLTLQTAFCGIICFFTFLTPVLLHLLTRGYVVRLYHRPQTDTYTAVTYSVFLTERRREFHQRQVRIPAVSRMFTSFYAGDESLLVNPDMFALPQDYNHLMGYDKPFTFNPDDVGRPEDGSDGKGRY